ncbi:hypothetical protein [Nostoc sp. FACHB-110]|uniref:hypothetical protein n=1 Tax=Nostoc sp. FACHB-110 TaxID=2692834 RepID=UPI00168637D1|nr:hypothetical protein [Nostoc sp. FACHB-110]MBD2437350.1 hypothetical protein [Nostoc sp. FACHB-110]
MSNFPPERIEEARNFCCCSPYQNRQICIYAGGGSNHQHNMYWAYVIYDEKGDRIAYETLPDDCLDVDDGLKFCEKIIDKWDAPLSYEDIRLWRDICEYLTNCRSPISSDCLTRRISGCGHLVDYDRSHRQKLWSLYKIQLIIYEKFSKKHQGWTLKGNWEDKIDFLEQVYILGRNPDTLPRPWLDKWERRLQANKVQELTRALKSLEHELDSLKTYQQWMQEGRMLNQLPSIIESTLEHLVYRCREAKSLLSELFKNEQ